jgi:uncharacterized damage-inducible protein DinB
MDDDPVVAAWRTNNRINLDLLAAVSDAGLEARPGAKGRSVAAQFAHLHGVRLQWLEPSAPDLAAGLPKFKRGDPTDRDSLRAALEASGEAIATLLARGVAAGKIKNVKGPPVAFLSYLIAHDSYHRAEIGSTLTQAGHPLDEKAAYAQWEAWLR